MEPLLCTDEHLAVILVCITASCWKDPHKHVCDCVDLQYSTRLPQQLVCSKAINLNLILLTARGEVLLWTVIEAKLHFRNEKYFFLNLKWWLNTASVIILLCVFHDKEDSCTYLLLWQRLLRCDCCRVQFLMIQAVFSALVFFAFLAFGKLQCNSYRLEWESVSLVLALHSLISLFETGCCLSFIIFKILLMFYWM